MGVKFLLPKIILSPKLHMPNKWGYFPVLGTLSLLGYFPPIWGIFLPPGGFLPFEKSPYWGISLIWGIFFSIGGFIPLFFFRKLPLFNSREIKCHSTVCASSCYVQLQWLHIRLCFKRVSKHLLQY